MFVFFMCLSVFSRARQLRAIYIYNKSTNVLMITNPLEHFAIKILDGPPRFAKEKISVVSGKQHASSQAKSLQDFSKCICMCKMFELETVFFSEFFVRSLF